MQVLQEYGEWTEASADVDGSFLEISKSRGSFGSLVEGLEAKGPSWECKGSGWKYVQVGRSHACMWESIEVSADRRILEFPW